MRARGAGRRYNPLSSPLRCVQALLACYFAVQLFSDYLFPLRTSTLTPEWWSWMRAAAPLVAIWLLEMVRRARLGSTPGLSREAAERIRWERPRYYGRTH